MSEQTKEKQLLLDEIKGFEKENEHILSNITRLKSGNKKLRLEYAILLENLERISKQQDRNNIEELPTLKNLTNDLNIATNSVLQYIIDNVSKPSEQKKQEFLDSFVKQQSDALKESLKSKNKLSIKDNLKKIVLEATLLNVKLRTPTNTRNRVPSSRGGKKRKATTEIEIDENNSDHDVERKSVKRRSQYLSKSETELENENLNVLGSEDNQEKIKAIKSPYDFFVFKNQGSSSTETDFESQWNSLSPDAKNEYLEEYTRLSASTENDFAKEKLEDGIEIDKNIVENNTAEELNENGSIKESEQEYNGVEAIETTEDNLESESLNIKHEAELTDASESSSSHEEDVVEKEESLAEQEDDSDEGANSEEEEGKSSFEESDFSGEDDISVVPHSDEISALGTEKNASETNNDSSLLSLGEE